MFRNAMLWGPWALFTALNLVAADVQFTSPKAGDTLTGGTAIVVEWKDSGDAPSISDLTTYQLFLCAGGNDEASIVQLVAITTSGTFTVTGNKATGTVGLGIGASTPKNAYFLKIISTASSGGTVTNYSPRFSLSGMSGTFPDTVITAMKGVDGTDGPPTVNAVNQGGAANPVDGDQFKVPYTMQTGVTRYAPMQKVPPTKITKKVASAMYPTSSVNIAKSILPRPKQQTTITQSQTFSVSSMENTVAAAAMPSDDMAKFLARWKD
ncbi:beta-1,6-glucan boisynthesis protein-like protein [Lindgomyces ingoldianus]|uniref:Beta-1,6-glucan boisynthesis protein-like protein n=1 Tax=Lindgomyces ingoldianus TaxID=673940 RepID=A0ACB6QU85_9PLEO|nr:beta-1,6-glucan boisynthesis protein-like protein [Lindgomyces ingoldianus]KAF2469640.1 beta-1,6-glucan boisynthesis protein-like protein [Lindgomyces ingoldianus]